MTPINPSVLKSRLTAPRARAVLYGRVSTGQQPADTQEARCKDYLAFKRDRSGSFT